MIDKIEQIINWVDENLPSIIIPLILVSAIFQLIR